MTIGWCFDNTYSKLPNSFKENINPVPVRKPELVILNNDLARELNLDFSSLGHDKLFYDIIYNPQETPFLKVGKQLGCKTENGKTMFVYQALEAFKLWHNIEPKINALTFKLLDND